MDPLQKQALVQDGDGYFTRNHAGIGTIADPIFDQLQLINTFQPINSMLEVGCATGFRLNKARQAFGSQCAGLEASAAAVSEGRDLYPDIQLEQGVAPADLNRWQDQQFDIVVLGHFMYLLPRTDLFSLAAEADRLLTPGGHLIVLDFMHPQPMSAPYAHHGELRVSKFNPSAPWMWSPTYTLVGRQIYSIADDLSVQANPKSWQTLDVLRKLTDSDAYPEALTLPSVHEGPA